MWVNIHNEWEQIEKINAKTLWVTLVLLFFCSVIPYATDLVSGDFNNRVTQGFYGIFVMLVTLSNIWLSKTLDKADSDLPQEVMAKRRRLLWIDIAIKVVGLVISVTVYAPAMMYSVIIAAAFLMISIHKMKLDWSDN